MHSAQMETACRRMAESYVDYEMTGRNLGMCEHLDKEHFYRLTRGYFEAAVSACFAGTRGFWPLFWTGYVEMTFVSISDFLILDCWLPPKAKPFIKGAEHCRAWERKEWLLKLAIPEHFLGWPLIFCPAAGLFVAAIGLIL